jgi:hypothetical protein
MYILVTDPDEEKADFFRSLNVHVVEVPRREGETEGQALEKFLLRLWNRTLDFDIYLNPEPRELSPTAKLAAAVSSYRRGDYLGAIQLFRQLEKAPVDLWRADPGVFAQYAYFRLKTLDKLNHWTEMGEVGRELLAMLDTFGDLYPASIAQSIRSQIHASIGLPMLRATRFAEAFSHLSQALAPTPDNAVIGQDAMLLHADRHTVLACIELCLFYFGETGGAEPLERAESNLAKAWELFRTFDSPDGPGEAHFLGRYFGAMAFLRIAALRTGRLAWSAPLGEELASLAWKSYREVEPGRNRVPYGKLAGRYCAAIVDLAAGVALRQGGDAEGARARLERAAEALRGLLAAGAPPLVALSPFERAKFNRALELALRELAALGETGAAAEADSQQELFRALAGSAELAAMDRKVLEDEHWVYMPLN